MSEEYIIIDESKTAVTERALSEIFTEAALEAGYETADTEIVCQPQLSMKWIRNGDWSYIHLFVSDYLVGLPRDAVEALARHLMAKLRGIHDAEMPESIKEALGAQEFAERHQRTFMERHGADMKGLDKALALALAKAEERGCPVPEGVAVGYVDSSTAPAPVASMRAVLVPKGVKRMSLNGKACYLDRALRVIASGVASCGDFIQWEPYDGDLTDNDMAILDRYIEEGAEWLKE